MWSILLGHPPGHKETRIQKLFNNGLFSHDFCFGLS
jgi:hypothetical protein